MYNCLLPKLNGGSDNPSHVCSFSDSLRQFEIDLAGWLA